MVDTGLTELGRSGTSLLTLVTGRSAATLHPVVPVAPELHRLPVLVRRTLLVAPQPALTDPVLDTAVGVRIVTVRLVAAV